MGDFNITQVREVLSKRSTISAIYVGDEKICYCLEDVDRYLEVAGNKKIYAQTAIPIGKYEVKITRSPRFKKLLPILLDVPGFTGIRLHPGNDDGDTEGCILPGMKYMEDWVSDSRIAFNKLYDLIDSNLRKGNIVYWTITRKK
jgi:hypothetical protein